MGPVVPRQAQHLDRIRVRREDPDIGQIVCRARRLIRLTDRRVRYLGNRAVVFDDAVRCVSTAIKSDELQCSAPSGLVLKSRLPYVSVLEILIASLS